MLFYESSALCGHHVIYRWSGVRSCSAAAMSPVDTMTTHTRIMCLADYMALAYARSWLLDAAGNAGNVHVKMCHYCRSENDYHGDYCHAGCDYHGCWCHCGGDSHHNSGDCLSIGSGSCSHNAGYHGYHCYPGDGYWTHVCCCYHCDGCLGDGHCGSGRIYLVWPARTMPVCHFHRVCAATTTVIQVLTRYSKQDPFLTDIGPQRLQAVPYTLPDCDLNHHSYNTW